MEYCKKGGKNSARVLKLSEKLENWLQHTDRVLSSASSEEDTESLLLDIEAEIEMGMFSDEESALEFTALLNDVHKGDVQSLLSSMKSKLNAWKFNQALVPLRMALVSTATDNGIENIFSLEVVSKIEDKGMKALFETTAKTVLVNTHGQAVGPDRLLLKLATKHNGWSFIQLMNVLIGPFVAAAKAIERESSKDNVCCNTVFNKLDKEAQDLFDNAANMILKSTNDQVVGREGVFMKMVSTHYSRIDNALAKHLNEILQMIENGSKYITKIDDEYVPIINPNESKEMNALHIYLLRTGNLTEDDTSYWKKQMFLDRGINTSKMKDAHRAHAVSLAEKGSKGRREAREAALEGGGRRKRAKRFTG